MTTCGDLIERVRDLVYGGAADEVNRLAAAHTVGDGALTFEFDPRGVVFGSPLSIGLSTFTAWTVDPITRRVEVTGVGDATHPVGTIVRVRPRVADRVILNALNRDVRMMSSPEQGLYAVGTWNPMIDPVDQAWAVPVEHAEMERVLAIRFTPAGLPDRWLEADGTLLTSDEEKRVVMNTMLSPSDTVEVTYAKPFGQFADLTTTVEEVGLSPEMEDIPVMGAAASVLWGQESRRNLLTAQSDTRRPEEVPAGAVTGSAREFSRQRQALLHAEVARLQRRYSYRRTLPIGTI